MDTSSRDRSMQGLQVAAPRWGWVRPALAPPQPVLAAEGVGVPNPRPAHPGTARAPGRQARPARVGCGSPAGWEGAPVRRGRGRGLDPPGAGVVVGGGGPPPERVRAGGGGKRGGPEEGGAQMQNGNFAPGRWGARAAAQVRRGGRARLGRAARSRPAGGGGGRVCRGVSAGRSRRAWGGGLAEAAGAAGGGAARPQRRPQPPGTAPSSAGWTRGENGGSRKGT